MPPPPDMRSTLMPDQARESLLRERAYEQQRRAQGGHAAPGSDGNTRAGGHGDKPTDGGSEDGKALASLSPAQRSRLDSAVSFIVPIGEERHSMSDILRTLGTGSHEHVVRLFALLARREKSVDALQRFAGGFHTALTAVTALDNLGTALHEASELRVPWSVGQPSSWQESQLRVTNLQLGLDSAREEASVAAQRHVPLAGGCTSSMDSSGRHHTDPPAVRPPAGATDTVPFTASTDDTVAAKACQRDVIAPACALPYVISQYAGLDAFEGLPVLEAAALLAMQPDKQGQAAWAWQNSTGKCRQKCADGMSVSLLGSHDRLGHWISATITTALGLLAADANPKLCIRVREAVQTWRVEALDVVIVWAARASADERTPNHIATHDGQLGDPTDLDKILTGIAEFESEVLKPFWGEAGQAEMLQPCLQPIRFADPMLMNHPCNQ